MGVFNKISKNVENASFTFEELTTFMAEIESILNSRPLTPSDPNDLQALTPGHFLIGVPLCCINDSGDTETGIHKSWVRMRDLKSSFWNRWSSEYLQQLQQRYKWTKGM